MFDAGVDHHAHPVNRDASVDENHRVSKRKRLSTESLVVVLDDNEPSDKLPVSGASDTPSLANDTPMSSLLKELAAEREGRSRNKCSASLSESVSPAMSSEISSNEPTYKVLTYNVWFEESVCMTERMAAIGAIVEAEKADFVFLQEVTRNIEQEFSRARWFAQYHSSGRPSSGMPYYTLLLARRDSVSLASPFRRAPFPNSQMGRDVVSVCGVVRGHKVRYCVGV